MFDHLAAAFNLNREDVTWDQVRHPPIHGSQPTGCACGLKAACLRWRYSHTHTENHAAFPSFSPLRLPQLDQLIDTSKGQFALLDALNYLSDQPKSLYRHNGAPQGLCASCASVQL